MKLNKEQTSILERAQELCGRHKNLEWDILCNVQEADRTKLHKALGKTLFTYISECFELDGGVAYSFMAVARKAAQIPLLQEALKDKKLRVSKANRIVSSLTLENAKTLIEFAITHTSREIDIEVANRGPGYTPPDKIKFLSGDRVQVTTVFSKQGYEDFLRAESLEAQRGNLGNKGATTARVLTVYLAAKDPVHKAHRAKTKPSTQKRYGRRPPTAYEKHFVMRKSEGRCAYIDENGQRCPNDRHLVIHHIHPVGLGGSNDPENLTLLCWLHHELVHQQLLPMEEHLHQ